MDKLPGNFNISVAPYNSEKELALQMIQGDWDGVFNFLLEKIRPELPQEKNFENVSTFRNALLSDNGVSLWAIFARFIQEHAQYELHQIGRIYFLNEVEKVLPEARYIIKARQELQTAALAQATQDAVESIVHSEHSVTRVQTSPQDTHEAVIQQIKNEAQNEVRSHPPEVATDAWKTQEVSMRKIGSFYLDSSGKQIPPSGHIDTTLYNAIISRDLRGNEFLLAKQTESELTDALVHAAEKGTQLTVSVEKVLLAITSASEHLSIEDQWNAILKYTLPLKNVLPLLIQHAYAGLLYYVFMQFPDLLSTEETVAGLKVIKKHYPQSAAKLIWETLEKNITQYPEKQGKELLKLLGEYDGSEEKIRLLLSTHATTLGVEVFLLMLELSFSGDGEQYIFDDAGLADLCAQKIGMLPETDIELKDKKSKHAQSYLKFVLVSIKKVTAGGTAGETLKNILKHLKTHYSLVQLVKNTDTSKEDILEIIQEHAKQTALELGLVVEEKKRSVITLGFSKKTGNILWA